ncbi:MAG: hypothetical protein ACOYM0_01135 [Bacteroidales bacterium]
MKDKENKTELIVKNRFFSIHVKKRETPNEFTNFSDALEKFKMEIFKALYIPQIVEWLSKRLK